MRGFIKISMFVIAMGACKSMMAQQLTAKAYDCYKQKDYACAQNWIDSAIVSNERSNSQTWQLRGVVYRNLETPQSKIIAVLLLNLSFRPGIWTKTMLIKKKSIIISKILSSVITTMP
ncbi:MAG: hypothetical protein MI810_15125 [Flavobacteriales bacterium]|nr:hypothetical protein [Flavobacteriales bacterium]